jgi:hypothetical protein
VPVSMVRRAIDQARSNPCAALTGTATATFCDTICCLWFWLRGVCVSADAHQLDAGVHQSIRANRPHSDTSWIARCTARHPGMTHDG